MKFAIIKKACHTVCLGLAYFLGFFVLCRFFTYSQKELGIQKWVISKKFSYSESDRSMRWRGDEGEE